MGKEKLSTWAKKLTSSCTDSSPQVGRELLWILVLQDELSDSSLAQRASRSHGSNTAFFFHQLAVDQSNQFPLHGSTQHALSGAAQPYTWQGEEKKNAIKDVLLRYFSSVPVSMFKLSDASSHCWKGNALWCHQKTRFGYPNSILIN